MAERTPRLVCRAFGVALPHAPPRKPQPNGPFGKAYAKAQKLAAGMARLEDLERGAAGHKGAN